MVSLPAEPQGKPKNTGVGEPFPSPVDFPNPGPEPGSPASQADSLPAEPPGKLKNTGLGITHFHKDRHYQFVKLEHDTSMEKRKYMLDDR